jgi:transposase
MIPQDVEVFLALEPVNMHLGFDRLAALVTEWMGRSARDPALYVFVNRRRTLLKALFFDGTGMCVFYKRLDRGRYRLPEPVDDGGVVEMSEEDLEQLLDGLEPGSAREGKHTLH